MAFATHVHGSGFASGGDRSKIRVDIVLPQANAGENVRRHVEGMRSGGRNLGVAAGGGQAEVGELRLVVAVDQIVRDTGMIRQIESKALRKLRHPSRAKKLRPFVDVGQ